MEGILLDTMFDLPSLEGVEEVVISKEVVEGTARPLYIYADSRRTATPARPRPSVPLFGEPAAFQPRVVVAAPELSRNGSVLFG